MNLTALLDGYFSRVVETLPQIDRQAVGAMVEALIDVHRRQGTVYVFGNGGSGANASHFTGDLAKGVSYPLKKKFKAVCLNENIPGIFAIANDISFEDVFSEQLKNSLTPNDLVIAISGSGNSPNILKAVAYARSLNVPVIGLCGLSGGKLKEMATLPVHVPIHDMEVSEDLHLMVFHAVKQALITCLKAEENKE